METTAAPLVVTHRSVVTEEQIDHLGHMNVRFYGVNAAAGTAAVLEALGRDPGIVLRPVDVYTRHHREQLLGARLVVRSGVADVAENGLRLYHELANEETGVLAATFVHRLRAEDATGAPARVPGALRDAAVARMVEVPAHGATRSISLDDDPVASAPSLVEVRRRDLAIRKVRAVTPEECAPDGSYLPAMAPALVWAGEPVHQRFPELLHEGPNGERMGWASMETRIGLCRMPRVGDRIQSFSAVIHVGDKVLHNLMWAFDVEREELLMTFEIVNLAFDIGARRPMVIPDRVRAMQETLVQPDLAPDASRG